MKRTMTAAAGLAVLAGAAACGGSSQPHPAAAPKVQLAALHSVSTPVKIGVVVTSDAGAEGSQDAPLAAGARLAAYRLSLQHGQQVSLDVADDGGTASGAAQAVQRLIADKVSGIVYASEGAHITDGVRAAAAAGTPVLLPYATNANGLPSGAWVTGPTATQVNQAITGFASAQQWSQPVVVTDDTAPSLSVDSTYKLTLPAASSPSSITQAVSDEIAKLGKNSTAGAAVVWATSDTSATVVAALQRKGVRDIVLGPDALSPVFAAALAKLETSADDPGGATTNGTFYSVGINATDVTQTDGMAGFLAALRLAARDQRVTSLASSSTCFAAGGAATADVRSHDAVVAIATAVGRAGDASPAAVRKAFNGLTVTATDGLAGPTLSFGSSPVVADRNVQVLEATAEPDSQRDSYDQPCSDGAQPSDYAVPALQWFAVPASS